LDYGWLKLGKHLVAEILVQWKHLPVENATWEPTTQLRELFPTLNLEDKVLLDGGGIDRPRRSERGLKPNPKYLGCLTARTRSCMHIDGKYKRSCMHAACTLLAVARGISWDEFTCKWDFNSCIIYVTFLSCNYIEFLLYVVLLFRQPQLLLMAIDYYSEQRYFLTRR
jgi:hypothetical protein